MPPLANTPVHDLVAGKKRVHIASIRNALLAFANLKAMRRGTRLEDTHWASLARSGAFTVNGFSHNTCLPYKWVIRALPSLTFLKSSLDRLFVLRMGSPHVNGIHIRVFKKQCKTRIAAFDSIFSSECVGRGLASWGHSYNLWSYKINNVTKFNGDLDMQVLQQKRNLDKSFQSQQFPIEMDSVPLRRCTRSQLRLPRGIRYFLKFWWLSQTIIPVYCGLQDKS